MSTTYTQEVSDFLVALTRFEEACMESAHRGAQRPVDWPEIDKEYLDSRQAVIDLFTHSRP